MAAPQIPNLLSLRGRGVGRGRGRRGGAGPLADEDPKIAKAKQDQIIQQTDTDANISRLSAVEAGYLDDPFAKDFAPSPLPAQGIRRFPIINRGTYARTKAIDRLVDDFLAAQPEVPKQIVSLGAGSDTRFFRLMSKGQQPKVVYHELDFLANTRHKLDAVRKSTRLKALIGEDPTASWTEDEVHSVRYHLHAIDLRTLNPDSASHEASRLLPQIDPQLPTLLLSECCLTYLQPAAADAVVNFFVHKVLDPQTPLGLVLYEPINPFDAFGKVMVSNLAARGIVLQTLHKYSSLEAQKARLKLYGFADGQRAVDVDFLHEHWIEEEEKSRISQVEMLDEVEELVLLMKHYCVAWGWRNGELATVWEHWSRVESQITGP